MRKVGAVILTFLAAVFLSALPAFAAKTPLSDDALDLITAAGEPKVIEIDINDASVGGTSAAANADTFTSDGGIASSFASAAGGAASAAASGLGVATTSISSSVSIDAGVSVTKRDEEESELTLDTNSQTTLKALTLNNVVGENEVATALNVASVSGALRNVSQTNTITQSWGSTKDTGAVTVPGVTATASAAFPGEKCILSDCADAAAAAAPGQIKRLTTHADQIVDISGGDASVAVDLLQKPQDTLTLGENSQSGLAALVVNNVAGKNLLASATNIASGALNIFPAFIGAGSSDTITQSNTINQFRGTPFSRPD